MTPNSGKDKFEQALQKGVIKKLLKAELWLAAEIFGHTPDDKERQLIDTGTCTEDEFYQRALKIAEVSNDKMLEENVRQRLEYVQLQYPLTPAARYTLEVFAERFYSFWDDGKIILVRSELTDFPEWYNAARKKAEKIFTADEMENILITACNKDRKHKGVLLWKLVYNFIDSEIIRTGYLYPEREVAREVLFDFFDKLKEILLIREQQDSSLQFGDDPEELISLVTANIIKKLLNYKLNDAIDNLNALSYLHYAAQETESNITGTDAYDILKNESVLFKEGGQCTWPNEIRKMFFDHKMKEILIRYRFTHGLIAVNTALAFRHAESGDKLELTPGEEDSIVVNGLILTLAGYIKSSGFQDTAIREQFIKDIDFFREIRNELEHDNSQNFFKIRSELDVERAQLADQLNSVARHVDQWVIGQRQIIAGIKEEMNLLETASANSGGFSLKKLIPTGASHANRLKKENLLNELEENEAMLKDLLKVSNLHQKTKGFFRKIARRFH